jgi:hypothetical protein
MRTIRWFARRVWLLIILALAAGSAGCGAQTTPCGTFAFTGAPNGSRGVDVTVTFNFNPASCSATCTSNTNAYIQIVRIIDITTGNFLAPNTDQQNRIVTGQAQATRNGWAVDRLANRVWGYYGRNNDGTFAGTLTTGSNTSAAVLRDSPSGWPDRSWFDAVSVPVSIDSKASCVNRLLGYYYWLFTVQSGGGTGNPFHEIGVDWNRNAFDSAVAEWNNDAPGLGKNTFPAMTRLEP